jgi:hypothetical protein
VHQKPSGKSYQWQGHEERELDKIDTLLGTKSILYIKNVGDMRYLARGSTNFISNFSFKPTIRVGGSIIISWAILGAKLIFWTTILIKNEGHT